ncbi:hypothetical protein KY306_02485 [Candidatus Woesearchaeota archaeon]|nr:hypothetical protein [Candidatus Woesearchaeota archaeon]
MKTGFVKRVGLVVLVMVGLLSIVSCATHKTSPKKSRAQLLAEVEQELQDKNQRLADKKSSCEIAFKKFNSLEFPDMFMRPHGVCEDCEEADDECLMCQYYQCLRDIEIMEKEIIELSLIYANAWTKEYATDPKYSLVYYWDPQSVDSQESLEKFLYVLTDPQFEERNQLAVVLVSAGTWDELYPSLINVFYNLRAETPDLAQFLKEIRFQMTTEQCGVAMPDKELPLLIVSKWGSEYPTAWHISAKEVFWTREVPGFARNSILALMMITEISERENQE